MLASGTARPSPVTEVTRRVVVTVGAVVLFLVAERLPLPFFGWTEFHLSREALPYLLTFLDVGIWPFFPAYVVVECVAAALPRLRRLRHGSEADRAPLTLAAWALALALAASRAWSMAFYFQGSGPNGLPMLDPGTANLLGVASTLVLGTALAGWLALMVSRHGIGNGFAVLFAVEAAEDVAQEAAFLARVTPGLWSDVHVLIALALLVVVPLVVAHQLRHRGARPRVIVPTCGLVPLQLAPMFLAFPYTVLYWLVPSRIVDDVYPGPTTYAFATLALAAALAFVLAHVFCPAGAVVGAFRRAAGGSLDERDAASVQYALSTANRRSWGLVVGIALLPVVTELGAPVRLHASTLLRLAIVAAVAFDVGTELRARTALPLVAARPLHRVYAVEPALEALQAAGIRGFARARRYRSLYHFFAPYAPIEILVPPERAAEADAICARIVSDPAVG